MSKQKEFHQMQKHLRVGIELSCCSRNGRHETQRISELRKEYKLWFNKHVRPVCNGNRNERFVLAEVSENGTVLIVHRRFLDETFAKNIHNNRLAETMEAATHFEEWIPCAKFRRKENGIHHPCSFLVYLAFYKGMSIEFKVKK